MTAHTTATPTSHGVRARGPDAHAPGNDQKHSSATTDPTQYRPSTNEDGSSNKFPDKGNLFLNLIWEFKSMQWMVDPCSSLKLVCILLTAWAGIQVSAEVIGFHNPLAHLVAISYRLPVATVLENQPKLAAKVASGELSLESAELVRYGKGVLDLVFIGFYVVVFSFLRQGLMLWVYHPWAETVAPNDTKKQNRIMEQCYAITYWGTFALFGLWVMSFQDSWWYNFEHFWIGYPHWVMRPELKVYYLLQGAYWLQQALVMILRLEAPRKDYYELVAHHLITLWLIGWSYGINLTMIGTSVFVAMDIPDTALGITKLLNYLDASHLIQGPVFVTFMGIWTYFRIYLSGLTLVSVYKDFWLIPPDKMVFQPRTGAWLAPWMRWQIFAPLFLLLLLNIFWYVLILRILVRLTRGIYVDEREVEDEAEPASQSACQEGKKTSEKPTTT